MSEVASSMSRKNETIEFIVPRVPPTINALMRKHWSFRQREKKVWLVELGVALCYDKALPRLRSWAEEGKRVRVEICVYHPRSFDPDNLKSAAKIPLDVLVKPYECLKGDKESDIELDVRQEHSKEKKTVFRITKLE
jgi:hypothetical protein